MAKDNTKRSAIQRIVGWSLLAICLAASLALVAQSEHNRIVAERAESTPAGSAPANRVAARNGAKSSSLGQFGEPLHPRPASPSRGRAKLQGPEAGNAIVQTLPAAVENPPLSPAETLSSPSAENKKAAGFGDFLEASRNAATAATVRIANPAHSSLGSGVLIGSRGPFAYILTADHVVQQAASMTFDTFDQAGRLEAVPANRVAEVLARSARADLALLRIRSSKHLPEVLRVCPTTLVPSAGRFPGLTVGCSGDEAPTASLVNVIEKRLVRRYAGGESSWVWQVDRETAKGRSGGPLVDRRGYVLGIGSGVSDGKGFYCHTDEIHRFLKENGLKWLYEEQTGQ